MSLSKRSATPPHTQNDSKFDPQSIVGSKNKAKMLTFTKVMARPTRTSDGVRKRGRTTDGGTRRDIFYNQKQLPSETMSKTGEDGRRTPFIVQVYQRMNKDVNDSNQGLNGLLDIAHHDI